MPLVIFICDSTNIIYHICDVNTLMSCRRSVDWYFLCSVCCWKMADRLVVTSNSSELAAARVAGSNPSYWRHWFFLWISGHRLHWIWLRCPKLIQEDNQHRRTFNPSHMTRQKRQQLIKIQLVKNSCYENWSFYDKYHSRRVIDSRSNIARQWRDAKKVKKQKTFILKANNIGLVIHLLRIS